MDLQTRRVPGTSRSKSEVAVIRRVSAVALQLLPRVVSVDEEFAFLVAQVDAQCGHLHADRVPDYSRLARSCATLIEYIHGLQHRLPSQRRIKSSRPDVGYHKLGIVFVREVKRGDDRWTTDGVPPSLWNVISRGRELLVQLGVGLEGGACHGRGPDESTLRERAGK